MERWWEKEEVVVVKGCVVLRRDLCSVVDAA